MAFNRPLNYIQNVPTNMGFSNLFAGTPSRTVSVVFNMIPHSPGTAKMGRIIFPITDGLTIDESKRNLNNPWHSQYTITGNVTDINVALNAAEYVSHYYAIDDTSQSFLLVDRTVGDYRGELCIQVTDDTDLSSILEDSFIRLSTHTPQAYYIVTRVDNRPFQKRIWCMFGKDYALDDLMNGSQYKKAAIGMYVQNYSTGANIALVTDISYQNPYGNYYIYVNTIDGTTEQNTLKLVGAPYIDEPSFLTEPIASVPASATDTWHDIGTEAAPWASIAQPANNFVSLQLMIKILESDPKYLGVDAYTSLPGYPSGGTVDDQLLFIGDAINTAATPGKAIYITDHTYGIFGDVQIDARTSVTNVYSEVKWVFYGIPADCNVALKRLTYFRPSGLTKDVGVETRLVTNRSRIYRNRGK